MELDEKHLLKIQHTLKGQQMLFERYYPQMYAVAIRYLKNREDAEDVLSEVFIRVFKKIGGFSFKGEGSLARWVKTIVINESLRLLAKKKQLLFVNEIDENCLEMTGELEIEVDMEYFLKLVNEMPEGYRLVFLMFVVDGFSHKEIAKELSISVSTSKSQLFKARSMLMKKIEKTEQNEIIGSRKSI